MKRLAACAAAVMLLAGCSGHRTSTPPSSVPAPTPARVAPSQSGPAFGVIPRDIGTIGSIAAAAGCRPRWVGAFVSVADGLPAGLLASIPGIPLLTVEPWHPRKGASQADFRLTATISGKWDAQYRQIATGVRAYGKPTLIRLAHEMNGNWYPWGTSGGSPAEYVAAWRHVVTLFRAEGVSNVEWVWSPNAVDRSVVKLAAWYPGDQYVGYLGVSGYGSASRPTPQRTFDATTAQLYRLSGRPVILTETGAKPGASKRGWIAALGPYLAANPRVVGFMWTYWAEDKPGSYYAGADWRFDDNAADLSAFRSTLEAGGVACAP